MPFDALQNSRRLIKLAIPLNPIKGIGELLARGVIRPIGGGLANLLFGSKSILGRVGGAPLAGSRLQYLRAASDPKAWARISPETAARLRASPDTRHLVDYIRFGGQSVPMKRKLTVGGLAGLVHRHPILSGLVGYGGYKFLSAPRQPDFSQMFPQAQQELAAYEPLPPLAGTF